QRLTRRQFLHTSAALGAATLSTRLAPADEKKPSANERLHVGVIGVNNQGRYNWTEVERTGAAIVARCDVDENRSSSAGQHFPQAKFFTDYRRLLDEKGLDAVIVATPDHSHAPATMRALLAGLHVYC